MIIYDRLLKTEIGFLEIEEPIVLGRYIFKTDKSILNGNKIKKHEYLVPCENNKALIKDATTQKNISFKKNELTNSNNNSLIKQTLLDVSEELKISESIDDFDEIGVLLRNFNENLTISDFEKQLEIKLFHIEEICRTPSYHLKREITKQNVSRAKRIPVRAINYLAAHSEDWSRRKIRAVEPRKILSEIIDYDLTIYENQITKAFIDKLLIHFSNRMVNEIEVIDEFIKKIETIITSRKSSNSNQKTYWYKKLDRDYKKLGKAINSVEKNRIQIEKIKTFILAIQRRLFTLLESELYRFNTIAINHSSQKLKQTNLFDNHQHYRFIKILWEEFHKNKELSCSEKSINNQNTVKAYTDYTWVIIIKALKQIGFNQIKKYNFNELLLENKKISTFKIRVKRNKNDHINILINDKINLFFTPIPTSETIDNNNSKKNNFIVTLADFKNTLKITPTDINSEEKIAKIIFKQILSILFSKHLFKLNSQIIAKYSILSNYLKGKKYIVNNSKDRKIDFYLSQKLNNNQLEALNKCINEQKKHLSSRTDIRKNEIAELKEISKSITIDANQHFKQYETCIKCASKNKISINNKAISCKCTNKDCSIEYGYENHTIFSKIPEQNKIETNLKRINPNFNSLNYFGYEVLNINILN